MLILFLKYGKTFKFGLSSLVYPNLKDNNLNSKYNKISRTKLVQLVEFTEILNKTK